MSIRILSVSYIFLLALWLFCIGSFCSEEATYHLSCLVVDESLPKLKSHAGEKIKVYHLSLNASVVKETVLERLEPTMKIYPNGRILSLTERLKGRQGRDYIFHISHPMAKTAQTLFMGPEENDFLKQAGSTTILFEKNTKALSEECYQYLVQAGLIHPSSSSLHGSIDIGAVDPHTGRPALSEDLDKLVMKLTLRDWYFSPSELDSSGYSYSSFYDVLLYYDLEQDCIRHICGSEKERYFFGFPNAGMVHDEKILFYRIKNFETIIGYVWEHPDIPREGGWEVCLYDAEGKTLEVLTEKGCRTRVYPETPILWSPDGTKFLFGYSKEHYYSNRLDNEFEGVYVYDFASNTYYRPTSKYPKERAICWAPDSKRYMVIRTSLSRTRGRPQQDSGYFIVDTEIGNEYPIIVFDRKYYPNDLKGTNGLADFRDTFRWSPDGKYIAFCAGFKENGTPYDGLFVMPDDRTGRYFLIEKAEVKKGVSMDDRFFYSPTWLNY